MNCNSCGSPLPDIAAFCPSCGCAVCANCESAPNPETPKKRRKTFLIATLSVLAVLIIAATVCFATNFFGLYGPGTRILAAAANTFGAGSLTADIAVNMEYDRYFFSYEAGLTGTVRMELDIDARTLLLHAELEGDSGGIELAIYQDRAIIGTRGYYYAQDISDALDDFFDSAQSGEKPDYESLMERIDEKFGTDLSDSVDCAVLSKCITAYAKKWNDTTWLEENAGYTCQKQESLTVYTFMPRAYTLLSATLSEFRSAFIDQDDYEDLCDLLSEQRSTLNDLDGVLSLGFRSGALETVGLEFDYEGCSCTADFTFSDAGSTEVDEEYLAQLLSKAE